MQVRAQRLHDRLSSAVQQALSSLPAAARSVQLLQGAAAAAMLSAVLLTGGSLPPVSAPGVQAPGASQAVAQLHRAAGPLASKCA